LAEFRKKYLSSYRSDPQTAEALTARYLDDPSAPGVYRVEANNLAALVRTRQNRFAEARRHCAAAADDENATALQRTTALLQKLQIAATDPQATAEEMSASLAEFQKVPYPAREQAAKAFEYMGSFHEKRQEYDQAIEAAKRQRTVAAPYEEGRILNRIAMLHDLCNRPDQAEAARREVVSLLTDKVRPAARSVFGAMMTFDFFEAVWGLSTSTDTEKRAAAELVLNHGVVSAETKRKVRERVDELDRR
jgi:hypothetical protein